MGEAFVRVSPEGAGFARKLQGMLQGAGLGNVGLLAGTAIVAGIGVGLSQIGAEFGKARRILTQEVGVASKDIDGLFDSVRRSALEVPASLDKIAAATAELFKRGVPLGPQLDKLAKQELFLAKITGTDLAGNVEQTTAIFAKFNVPLREQSKELDVLFKAQQRSGKGLADLLTPLQSGGAALQEFGFDLEHSAALIANLEAAGVNVQPALAALRKAFGQLAKEGKDPQQALASLVEEFKSGTNPAHAMADAMKLFGSRAGLELARAIKSGKFEVADLLKVITDGKGGIIATGEATLTLGDRFKLLRNRIEDDLSGLGIAVRGALVAAVIALSEPLERVGAAIAHLIKAAAPLAIIFAPLEALRLVVPILGSLATGLDTIATILGLLPGPVTAAVGGLIAIGLAATVFSTEVGLAAIAVQEFTASLLENPYFLVAAALVAIGTAVQVFRSKVDPAIALSKQFSDAMFTADDASTIFAGGLTNATAELNAFFEAQVRGSKTNFTAAILAGTGATVDQLTAAVTGSKTSFDSFAKSASDAFKEAGANAIQQRALNDALGDLPQAYALTAKAQVNAAIQTGVLTRSEKNAIIEQNRFKDGSVDLAGVLDDVNERLRHQTEAQDAAITVTASFRDTSRELAEELAAGSISAEDAQSAIGDLGLSADAAAKGLEAVKANAAILTAEQDKLSLSTISTSKAYGILARGIAQGSISQVDATTTLEAMGLSATGAASAFTDLQGQVKTFIDGALAALPTVADAVQKFQSDITSDQGNLASDVGKAADLQKQLAAAGGKASDELRASIHENNLAIVADFHKLAADTSPQAFTNNLLANAKQITLFNHNIRVLVGQGLGALAGDLAKLGPEQAGTLAASLASNPSQAKVANSASQLAASATDSYKKTLEKNIGPLALTGEAAGKVIGTGISKGIIAELLKEIPQLKDFGIGAGDKINEGVGVGAGTKDVTVGVLESLRRAEGRFGFAGTALGTKVGEGAKTGASGVDVTAGIETAIRRGGGKVRAAGRDLGSDAGAGVIEGIRSQFKPVGDAFLALTQHGVAVARGSWRITSPSKVFMEIGSQVGAGLALGITASASGVGEATALLASEATTSVTDQLRGLKIAPAFTPTIAPKVAPITLPPIDPPPVTITPTVAPIAPIPPVLLDATVRPVEVPQPPTLALDGTVTASLPKFDPIVLSGSFAPIAPPVVPPAQIDATVTASLPSFAPVDLSGVFAPIEPPTIDPVVISGSLTPIAAPVIPPTSVDATVTAALPSFDPVVLSGSLAPVAPPTFDPLVLAAHLAPIPDPTFDPINLVGALAPVAAPKVPPLTLTASLGPFSVPTPPALAVRLAPVAPPQVPPVVIQTTLEPFTVPLPPPIPASLAPIAPPDLAPVVIPASLAPFTVPQPPPLDLTFAPAPAPLVPPVVIPTSLAPFRVPNPPTLTVTLAPIPTPQVDPVTIGTKLAPFEVPALAPIEATLAPLTAPPVDPVVIPSTLAPFTVPTPPPIKTNLAPLRAPEIDPVVISASLGALPAVTVPPIETTFAPLVPPAIPAVVVPASLSPIAAPVIPPIATTFADLPPLDIPPVVVAASLGPVAPPKVDPIQTKFAPLPTLDIPPIDTSFAPIVPPIVPALHASVAPVPSQALDLAFEGAEAAGKRAGVTATQGLADGLSAFTPTIDPTKFARAGQDAAAALAPAMTLALRGVGGPSDAINALAGVGGPGTGGHGGAGGPGKGLVDGFRKSFDTIRDDAEELRRFLAGLGGTKLAFDQPPSRITIAEAAQSVPVAAPQLRADAQRQQKEVRNVGLFDGATLNFPEKIDPLHIASEIVWRLL